MLCVPIVSVVPPLLAYATPFNGCYLALITPPYSFAVFVVFTPVGIGCVLGGMLSILSYIGFSLALQLFGDPCVLRLGLLTTHSIAIRIFAYLLRCNAPFLYLPLRHP